MKYKDSKELVYTIEFTIKTNKNRILTKTVKENIEVDGLSERFDTDNGNFEEEFNYTKEDQDKAISNFIEGAHNTDYLNYIFDDLMKDPKESVVDLLSYNIA